MPLPVLLLVASIFYALFMVLISRASGKANDFLLNGVVGMVGAIVPLVIYGFIKAGFFKGWGAAGENTKEGLLFGALAGIAIAIYSVLLVKAFDRGGNLAYVTPVVYGGAIVISSLIGWVVFKEAHEPLQVCGVLLVALGIGLLVVAKL